MFFALDVAFRTYAAATLLRTFLLKPFVLACAHVCKKWHEGTFTLLTFASSIILAAMLSVLIWVLVRWVLFNEAPQVNIDRLVIGVVQMARDEELPINM